MIPFKLGDEEFEIPEDWSEVTVNQFIAIRSMKLAGDLPVMMSILSGLSITKWNNAELTSKEISLIAVSLEWMKSVDFDNLPLPEIITIGGRGLKVPKEISELPLACKQYFEMKVLPLCNMTTDEEGAVRIGDIEPEAIPFAIASYMMKPYTGSKEFSTDDIEDVEREIGNCKIVEAFPVAGFFLRVYLDYENAKQKYNIQKTKTSKGQGLRILTSSET